MTGALSKEVLPVYDKPMLYYSLATVMLAGIRDMAIVTNPDNNNILRKLLGNGSRWGISINFMIQREPKGIADALLLARDFVGGGNCMLILGDNILLGSRLEQEITCATDDIDGCTIFGFQVDNPEQYGVVSFDDYGAPTRISEKPAKPDSNWAIPGIYFYDNDVFKIAADLTPSDRGEIEISDVNHRYLADGKLKLHRLGSEFSWFDAGTPERFLDAANYIRDLSHSLGKSVMAPEEIAHSKNWVSTCQLAELGQAMLPSEYGKHLLAVSRM